MREKKKDNDETKRLTEKRSYRLKMEDVRKKWMINKKGRKRIMMESGMEDAKVEREQK